jgi:hypothetical protein
LQKRFASGRRFSLHTDETDGARNSNEQSLQTHKPGWEVKKHARQEKGQEEKEVIPN